MEAACVLAAAIFTVRFSNRQPEKEAGRRQPREPASGKEGGGGGGAAFPIAIPTAFRFACGRGLLRSKIAAGRSPPVPLQSSPIFHTDTYWRATCSRYMSLAQRRMTARFSVVRGSEAVLMPITQWLSVLRYPIAKE